MQENLKSLKSKKINSFLIDKSKWRSAIFICKREALRTEKNDFRSRAPLLSKGPYKRPPAPSSVKIWPPPPPPFPPSPSCLVHYELELWQNSNFRKRVGTSYITWLAIDFSYRTRIHRIQLSCRYKNTRTQDKPWNIDHRADGQTCAER